MADNSEYLSIKNWSKYQPGRTGKSEWIKDYTDKDHDSDYMNLTCLQRYVLDGLCRLRGRLGHNPHNESTYIIRALHIVRTDAPHVTHAVRTLCARGFLAVTNQQLDSEAEHDKRRKEEKRGEETLPETSPSAIEQKPIEMDRHSAAKGLGEMVGMSHAGWNLSTLTSAIDQGKRRWPELKNEDIAEKISALWREYIGQPTHVKVNLKTWLDTVGRYIDSGDWRVKAADASKGNTPSALPFIEEQRKRIAAAKATKGKIN